jgi:HlyD family secretion protein
MLKKKRNLFILIAVAAVVGISLAANFRMERKDRVEVTADQVERGAITAKVSGPGRVRAETTVQVSSSVMGRVVKLGVHEGDVIEKGQFLLQLDDVYYRSQVEQARAQVERAKTQLATAERDLSHVEDQFEQSLVSEKERDDARALAATSREAQSEALAGLRASQDQLDKTVFRSPIRGVVSRLNIEEGENVVTGTMNQAGTVIMTLSDLSTMEVEVEIDETDVVDVTLGQKAEITVDALGDTVLQGTVTEVGNSGIASMAGTQEEVTNFLVKVAVESAHSELKPGMTATVDIVTAVHENVLNVPIQSVVARTPSDLEKEKQGDAKKKGESEKPKKPKKKRTDQEKEKEIEGVFVSTKDGNAEFVTVTTGIADELSIEVTGTLEEGQKVISGPYKVLRTLKNGQALKIKEEEKKKGTASSSSADEKGD